MYTPQNRTDSTGLYDAWENIYQELSFDIKAGQELHALVLNFAYRNRLHLHRLQTRWPTLSGVAVSRSTQTVLALAAVYLLSVVLFLALDGIQYWAAHLDKGYTSDGAPPSDLQQHRNLAQAQRDAGLLFGFLPLCIVAIGSLTYWWVDRPQLLTGYRHFRRATGLRDYPHVDIEQFLTQLTMHIQYLLTLRHEAGCVALAHLFCSLQEHWIDDPTNLFNPIDQPSSSAAPHAVVSPTKIQRADLIELLLFITLKKMAYPLNHIQIAQRQTFLCTLIDDPYYRHHTVKLGRLLLHFFSPCTPGYDDNLATYRQLHADQKQRILMALLSQNTAGEVITKVLLRLPEPQRFRDQLLTHFISQKKPNAVRLQLECQNFRSLEQHDATVITALLS